MELARRYPSAASQLRRIDIETLFLPSIHFLSARANQRKPSPKIFKSALATLGVDASRAVFVGDMVDLDIAGPQSVGMKTVLIKRKRSGEDSSARPDVVIRSLTEQLRIIEGC